MLLLGAQPGPYPKAQNQGNREVQQTEAGQHFATGFFALQVVAPSLALQLA